MNTYLVAYLTLIILFIIFILFIYKYYKKENKTDKNWTIDKIQKLDPYTFEDLIEELWREKGYKVTKTTKSRDGGIDVYATDWSNNIYGIEVKRYSGKNKVGRQEIQRLSGAILQHDCKKGILVTSNKFTKPAKDASNKLNIRLINGEEITEELNKYDI